MAAVLDYSKFRTSDHILGEGPASTYALPKSAKGTDGQRLGFTHVVRMPMTRGLESNLTYERGALNFDVLGSTFDQDVDFQMQNPATYDAFRYLVHVSKRFSALVGVARAEHEVLMREYFSHVKSINNKRLGAGIFGIARAEEVANGTHVLQFARLDEIDYVTIGRLTQAGLERYKGLRQRVA